MTRQKQSTADPEPCIACDAVWPAHDSLHAQNALHSMQPGERCRRCQRARTAMGGQAQMNMEVKPRALT